MRSLVSDSRTSYFFAQALVEAERGRGCCAPNPAVGAVVVREDQIIARGWHAGPGQPHAEVHALSQVADARDCDLYVTLEPCCHHGRTPPCTDLIISRQVSRVFYAYPDPNPRVLGQGHALLEQAGIDCVCVPQPAIQHFYRAYAYWTHTQLPYVTVKLALTGQGALACDPLTGPEAMQWTHEWRAYCDALLTTSETVLADDPRLNPRLVDPALKKPIFILDSDLRVPKAARIFDSCHPITIFHDETVETDVSWRTMDVVLQPVESLPSGLDLEACLAHIGQQGYHHLWVEAGWRCTSALLKARGVNEWLCYIAANQDVGRSYPIEFVYLTDFKHKTEWGVLGKDAFFMLSKDDRVC